jgi:hypothetical protein
MRFMTKRGKTSPDGKHLLSFRYIGDIRFGPSFYRLRIDGRLIKDQYFAHSYMWSSDARFLAVQKWLEINPHHGPHTAVMLIDLNRDVYTEIAKTYRGIASPVRFTKDSIEYSKEYIAPGLPPIFEERRLISELKEWNKVEFFMPTVEMQSTRPGNEEHQK